MVHHKHTLTIRKVSKMELDTKRYSLILSAELDNLGFSKADISERVEQYNIRSKAKALATKHVTNADHMELIIVGSRREGLAFHSSDTDILVLNHNIVCLNDKERDSKAFEDRVVLKAELRDDCPGYAILKTEDARASTRDNDFVTKCSVPSPNDSHEMLFSGDKYVEMMKKDDSEGLKGWRKKVTCYKGRSGPALRKVVEMLGVEVDLVRAIPIRCPDVVKEWQQRERKHSWPPRQILQEANNHQCYVVPTGKSGNAFEQFQWRLCFTETEMALVNSMTHTQLKIFVLLKLLAKYLLTPLCEDISSYVVKNVMFWTLESFPGDRFQPECLVDGLIEALAFLHKSVETRYLPVYMLPGRNLFNEKLNDAKIQRELLKAIKAVTNKGLTILDTFIRYKLEPEILKKKLPRIFAVYLSLLKTKHENDVVGECMKVLDIQRLKLLHVAVMRCPFSWMLLWCHIWQVFLPYIWKFGFKKFFANFCATGEREERYHEADTELDMLFATKDVVKDKNISDNKIGDNFESIALSEVLINDPNQFTTDLYCKSNTDKTQVGLQEQKVDNSLLNLKAYSQDCDSLHVRRSNGRSKESSLLRNTRRFRDRFQANAFHMKEIHSSGEYYYTSFETNADTFDSTTIVCLSCIMLAAVVFVRRVFK